MKQGKYKIVVANISAEKNTIGVTGERLWTNKHYLDAYNIPKENVIDFASDRASNITANSITTKVALVIK